MARAVIVVGAGIAGLTAAWRLQSAGCAVTVLEASDRVGGRMTTDVVDGFTIDRGAQFLSSGYSTLMPLIRELGMEGELRDSSPFGAVVRGGVPRRIRGGSALSAATSGILGLGALVKLGLFNARMGRRIGDLPLDDYGAWHEHDDEDAAVFYTREAGREATEYVLEPTLEGFYYQAPEGTSKALALMLLGFAVKKGRAMTLARGIGSLPEALAERLDVRLGAPVARVEAAGERVVVHAAGGERLEADWAVLASTATATRGYLAAPTEAEARLLETRYSSTVNIAVATDRHWRSEAALRDVYGLFIPRKERQVLAAVGIETQKDPGRAPSGELLDLMLSGEKGAELVDAPEERVLGLALGEAERYFPGVERAKRFARLYRWKEAEPRSPIGRSRAIRAYREGWTPARRFVLAGDYTGMPYTDGAAHTGAWAAARILEHARGA